LKGVVACLIVLISLLTINATSVEAPTVLQPAGTDILEYRTYESPPTQQPITYTMIATAYTHTGYRTATGTWPSRGTIAVDPRVIPLGTRLYVDGYGEGVAVDTGGFIKGARIDVFMETKDEALSWGRRQVEVKIIKDY
jgi:3D (Asp-Asp-Asp) domain-containing protein